MRTRNTLAALLAATALSLAGGGVALAAPAAPAQTGPNTQACTDALRTQNDAQAADTAAREADEKAADTDSKADAAEADDVAFEAAVKAAAEVGVTNISRDELKRLEAILPTDPLFSNAQKQIKKLEVALDAKREAEKADAAALRNKANEAKKDAAKADASVTGRKLAEARAAADKACGAPAPTTTPAPPAPTSTPVPPAANDVDCVDVSRAEAQRILNADKSDPNNLDSNNNGTACEEGTPTVIVNNNDNGAYPSRAPQTGGV